VYRVSQGEVLEERQTGIPDRQVFDRIRRQTEQRVLTGHKRRDTSSTGVWQM
jgi:hypothetical protein